MSTKISFVWFHFLDVPWDKIRREFPWEEKLPVKIIQGAECPDGRCGMCLGIHPCDPPAFFGASFDAWSRPVPLVKLL